MLEDNPFYRESSDVPEPAEAPEYSDMDDDAAPDTAPPEQTSETPPESSATGTLPSAGVATYTSVPDIGSDAPCAAGTLRAYDKLNLWSVLAVVALLVAAAKGGRFESAVNRVARFLRKYALLSLAALFGAALMAFTFPRALGAGVSGDMSLFAMLEFGFVVFLNATSSAYFAVSYLRRRDARGDGPVSFDGVKFLQMSMWTFLASALLFLFFTESRIAFMAFYAIAAANAWLMFSKLCGADLRSLDRTMPASIGMQLAILGSLTGMYLILMAGAVLAGRSLASPDERRRVARILKRMV
ncbi:MAG: hypothetical protein LBI17_01070 [Rickettsiales bacterium]|jgi:hypothetical protein|nr:hypothetical protein [Rickettsiales bacterium]